MPIWAIGFLSLALLVVRALLAAAEAALHGTSETKARELVTSSPRQAHRVLRQKGDRERVTGALRLSIVSLGFLAVGLGTLLAWRSTQLWRAEPDHLYVLAPPLLGALATAALSALLDVTARSLAAHHPSAWAMRLSGLVSLTTFVVHPFVRLLVSPVDFVLGRLDLKLRFEPAPPPLEELEKLLEAQAAQREVDQGAPQLIRSIFELSDKTCRDVMVPRTEVVALDITTPPKEILRVLAEENHSRLPVYRDDIDHIIGVLHVRDLIPMMQHPELIVLADTLRPAEFVPWVKPIGDLLRDMQRRKIHMAMVVDEYGGFMGIVTLEDILREIVGDIGDEFEVEDKPIEKQADGSFLVDAAMHSADFTRAFGFSLPEGEYETLAGFLSSLSGSIPEVGDRFAFNGWQFTIHAKSGPRLDRVRLSRPKPPSAVARDKDRAEREPAAPAGPPAAAPAGRVT